MMTWCTTKCLGLCFGAPNPVFPAAMRMYVDEAEGCKPCSSGLTQYLMSVLWAGKCVQLGLITMHKSIRLSESNETANHVVFLAIRPARQHAL